MIQQTAKNTTTTRRTYQNRVNYRRTNSRPITKNRIQSAKPSAVPSDEAVRFVPLGGLEEVGRNCAYFEHKDEIIIIYIFI